MMNPVLTGEGPSENCSPEALRGAAQILNPIQANSRPDMCAVHCVAGEVQVEATCQLPGGRQDLCGQSPPKCAGVLATKGGDPNWIPVFAAGQALPSDDGSTVRVLLNGKMLRREHVSRCRHRCCVGIPLGQSEVSKLLVCRAGSDMLPHASTAPAPLKKGSLKDLRQACAQHFRRVPLPIAPRDVQCGSRPGEAERMKHSDCSFLRGCSLPRFEWTDFVVNELKAVGTCACHTAYVCTMLEASFWATLMPSACVPAAEGRTVHVVIGRDRRQPLSRALQEPNPDRIKAAGSSDVPLSDGMLKPYPGENASKPVMSQNLHHRDGPDPSADPACQLLQPRWPLSSCKWRAAPCSTRLWFRQRARQTTLQ